MTTKQTTSNNLFLHAVKALFNNRIFDKATALVNAGAEDQARDLTAAHGHRFPEKDIWSPTFVRTSQVSWMDNADVLYRIAKDYVIALDGGNADAVPFHAAKLRKAIRQNTKGIRLSDSL